MGDGFGYPREEKLQPCVNVLYDNALRVAGMMEELQQLVKLIERKGRLSGTQLINFSDDSNLEVKLYSLLKDNENLKEEEAIEHLYGDSVNKDAFKMLKSRFRRKLFNQLNFLDFSDYDSRSGLIASEVTCNKLLSETNVLFRTGNEQLAEKQVTKALKIAQDAKLTKQIVEALEQLLDIAVINHRKSRVYELKGLLEQQYVTLGKEREAAMLYRISIAENKAGVNAREQYLVRLYENVERLKVLWGETQNSFIYSRYHFLQMLLFEQTGSFPYQISFLREAKQLLQKGVIHPYYYNSEYNSYVFAYSCLRSGFIEEGLSEAERLSQILKPGRPNWFSNNENLFMLAIYSKNYEKAGLVLQSVSRSDSFIKLSPSSKERWRVFEGFFNLLTDVKHSIKPEANYKVIPSDKKGFNIWLLILDFLTLLKNSKLDLLQREPERIRKYTSKYLSANADPRYKIFLKLLILIVREDFELAKVKQKSKYLVSKLSQTPPAGDAYAEVEIVPFEHLWEFIVNCLTKLKVKASKV